MVKKIHRTLIYFGVGRKNGRINNIYIYIYIYSYTHVHAYIGTEIYIFIL